jgi:hypothetical protein
MSYDKSVKKWNPDSANHTGRTSMVLMLEHHKNHPVQSDASPLVIFRSSGLIVRGSEGRW